MYSRLASTGSRMPQVDVHGWAPGARGCVAVGPGLINRLDGVGTAGATQCYKSFNVCEYQIQNSMEKHS